MSKRETVLSTIKVLIIEDDENDVLLLVDHLRAGGISLQYKAIDNEEALLSALEEQWDIVLSDYSIPGFGGARALEMVRAYDRDVPFVFVSGTIGEEVAVSLIKSGANDYVMKASLSRLIPTIERELHDHAEAVERRQVQQKLRKLSLAVTQTIDSVFITDSNGHIEYVNPAFERLTGYRMNEVEGETPSILRSGVHGDSFYKEMWEQILRGKVFEGVLVNRSKGGDLFHEEKVITPLRDEVGNITHFVSTGRDITEKVKAEEERNRLASVLQATPDLVAIHDPSGRLLYLNHAGYQLLGFEDKQDLEGRCLRDIFPEDMAEKLLVDVIPYVSRHQYWSGETLLQMRDGKELPVSLVVVGHRGRGEQLEDLSIIARDLSERYSYERELKHRATHDSLTDLPNRFYLIDRLESALQRARRHAKSVAIVYVDLDNFKRINDSLGHEYGDLLLKQVAVRLDSVLRPGDTVSRHGGDEFAILLDDLKSPDDVVIVLRRMHAGFERSIRIDQHELYVTFSTGIALFPGDGDNAADLLRHADTAMYQAKKLGSSQYRFYAPTMNARGHEFLELETDLRRALERQEFELYCQPQFNLKQGRIVAAEALLRWHHPIRGIMSPADFIPLLESTGLIIKVGAWVMAEACRLNRMWARAGFGDLRISLNVSATQFSDAGLLKKVRNALEESGLPRGLLEVEITEDVVMYDPVAAARTLQQLHQLGVRTAVDDFGTGYSSMAYLKQFPLDVLKIDQAFVRDLGQDESDEAIVEASLSLAQKLGLETVAEGVETREQLRFLQQRGCDNIQGYLLSKPLPGERLPETLAIPWDFSE